MSTWNKHLVRIQHQTGFSSLLTVMLLMAIGMVLLTAQHRQMAERAAHYTKEREYLQSYQWAISALSWAVMQTWPAEEADKQRQRHASGWEACLFADKTGEQWILSGQDIRQNGRGLRLFHLIDHEEDDMEQIRLTPHGWLDYCPDSKEEICD